MGSRVTSLSLLLSTFTRRPSAEVPEHEERADAGGEGDEQVAGFAHHQHRDRRRHAAADSFGDDCRVHTVTAPDGRLLSSVLSFYFRGEALPYYAGDDFDARGLAANDFKYWCLLKDACERGYRTFDYGRSKVGTGPYSFKKNWGFEPTPLAYEYRLYKRDAVPQNNPMNPKYRAFIAMWRRLPLPVANALGPYIVRNLG